MRSTLQEFFLFFSDARRIAVLATGLSMFTETSKWMKICLHSFASKPNGPWLTCVYKVTF